jgi:hypothetical protein
MFRRVPSETGIGTSYALHEHASWNGSDQSEDDAAAVAVDGLQRDDAPGRHVHAIRKPHAQLAAGKRHHRAARADTQDLRDERATGPQWQHDCAAPEDEGAGCLARRHASRIGGIASEHEQRPTCLVLLLQCCAALRPDR